MPETDRAAARAAIRAHVLAWCATSGLPSGALVAAYEPLRTEPGSIELLMNLLDLGFTVIVPELLADKDLDWALWSAVVTELDSSQESREHEPVALDRSPGSTTRETLGRDAISEAGLVLVPAFAVDPAGQRLGRGGGSYDRALARVQPAIPVAALLFEDEFVSKVPVQKWDIPVTAVVTPSGWRYLSGLVRPS
jgi:5-formyltetrahydrofolate cyclo-ligase